MKNFIFCIRTVLPVVLALCSCDRGLVHEGADTLYTDPPVEHGMMALGEKLDDPYTVENMMRAYQALYPTKARTDIIASDLYVRFLPYTQAQYDYLESLGLELLDHPVDYSIVREGDWYHDPEVPEGDITWQYAVVPADFHFPGNIVHEILDECYIAEHVPTRAADVDWAAVEREAFRLTGNAALLHPETRGGTNCPSGRITIIDDLLDGGTQIPVTGVKVAVNSFVKVSTAYTDEQGRYSINRSYSGKVRYRLVFKNKKGFGIGLNLLLLPGSVSTLGTGKPEGKSELITNKSDRKLWTRCIANNAAYDYYNWCDDEDSGVMTPSKTLRMWLMDILSDSCAPMARQGTVISIPVLDDLLREHLGEYAGLLNIFFPDIIIGTKDAQGYAQVYSVVWHELAHASHYEKVGNDYWNRYILFILTSFLTSGGTTYGSGHEEDAGLCAVGEMWAYYMQTLLVNTRYGITNYTAGTGYWFHPQILLYMSERGMKPGQFFKAMDASAESAEDLRSNLLDLYPEYKTVIRQAFERYE